MKDGEAANLKRLAEAVIMQAVSDLWSRAERKRSIAFFMGREFARYSKMAGMQPHERARLLDLIKTTLGCHTDGREQRSAA